MKQATIEGEMNTQAPSVAGTMNLLTRLSRVIYRRAVPELIGIKIKEFVALVYLRESGKATQQKLAETMMMDANNCVILLNGLEDEGLIARTGIRRIAAATSSRSPPRATRLSRKPSGSSRPSRMRCSASSTTQSETSCATS